MAEVLQSFTWLKIPRVLGSKSYRTIICLIAVHSLEYWPTTMEMKLQRWYPSIRRFDRTTNEAVKEVMGIAETEDRLREKAGLSTSITRQAMEWMAEEEPSQVKSQLNISGESVEQWALILTRSMISSSDSNRFPFHPTYSVKMLDGRGWLFGDKSAFRILSQRITFFHNPNDKAQNCPWAFRAASYTHLPHTTRATG